MLSHLQGLEYQKLAEYQILKTQIKVAGKTTDQ